MIYHFVVTLLFQMVKGCLIIQAITGNYKISTMDSLL